MFRNITYSILATMVVFSSCGAGEIEVQDSLVEVESDSLFIASYPFVNTSADTLFDPSGNMKSFYAKLKNLDPYHTITNDTLPIEGDVRRVNIIHFGDSHIQGGSISDVIMRHLHTRFGNAGRGMIIPHRLSGHNEPSDYVIQTIPNTKSKWTSSRVINSRPELPIGISGISIQSPTATNRLLLSVLPLDDSIDYRFNRVRVFHGQYAPIIEADDTLCAELSAPDIILDFNTDIDLVSKVDSLELRTYSEAKFSRGPIYGFSLENGEPGVLYHSLGVNGACYVHWAKQSEVVRQSMALDPDLIILSMGSNEAAGSNFIDEVFYREINRFVAPLREANPDVSILLTAPAEAFRKGVPNVNFERVSRVLKQYAEQKGVGFIDIYNMTGGEGSAKDWVKHDLMGRDKIHYNKEGYRIQGILIYNALYNGYIGHDSTAQ